jgi:hypothetical protein
MIDVHVTSNLIKFFLKEKKIKSIVYYFFVDGCVQISFNKNQRVFKSRVLLILFIFFLCLNLLLLLFLFVYSINIIIMNPEKLAKLQSQVRIGKLN